MSLGEKILIGTGVVLSLLATIPFFLVVRSIRKEKAAEENKKK